MQFNPFLKYSYKLNGEKIVGISLGSNVTEKAEESLDEGGFHLPINVRDIEYEMNGTLEIEVKDSRNNVKVFTYLIIFDEVHKTSVYGWFTHSIRVVEYTNKLNGYFVDTLIKSFPNQRRNVSASRTIPTNNYIRGESTNSFRVVMPNIDIKEIIFMNDNKFTINGGFGGVDYIKLLSAPNFNGELATADLFVTIDNDPTTLKNLSNGNATFQNVSEGFHTIQYGLINVPDLTAPTPTPENPFYPNANVVIYEFYITTYNNAQITLYDVVNKLRNIKPFETKFYHPKTRLFNIDDNVVVNGYTMKDILQKTQAPQFFIQKATMFQVLSGIFKYINSIPRLLRNGNDIDKLIRDDFNEVVGMFNTSGMYDYTSSQDIQLYGTRGISPLERTLPTSLDKPNIESPANNFFKTIRATNVQLTMNNNEWYIPLEEDVYLLTKFEVYIPNAVSLTQNSVPNGATQYIYDFPNGLIVDLTGRTIDKRLWDLKDNENYFPSLNYITNFNEYVGARNNKSGNIYWQQGENGIRIANYIGELIKESLLTNVIKEAINDRFSYEQREDFYVEVFGGSAPRMVQQLIIDSDDNINVKDLKFNIEYITLQDFNVSQDREDRSIIKRFSEIALKQSDKQINVELASRKSYGELQRGALPNYSFSMVHNYLDEIIDLFTVDEEGYTIVERSMTFYNTYIDVVYVATKNHNRLQDFIGVNQEYRAWEIPSSNKIYDRKESYVDYIFIVPSNQDINYTVTRNLMTPKFYRQLVSNLQNDKTHTKITFSLVYTDGFGQEYNNIQPFNYFRLLIVPTIVVGSKQSLVFSVGFNDNQLAGNMLEVEGLTTYNKAVRYTDFKGELNEFWMALYSNIEDLGNMLDTSTYNYDDYPLTPEIAQNSIVIPNMMDNSLMNNGTILTNNPLSIHGEYNPFIVDKDSHENLTVQYNVSVMSYNYEQFIVGQRFTSFNPLVNNDLDNLYIYVYDEENYTKYGIFNDQAIRNMGNATKVLLSQSIVVISDINYGQNRYGVKVEFVGTLKTLVENNSNWAIGDDQGNLYIACNENITSFDFLGTHRDIRVKEIGKDPIIYNAYIYTLDNIISSIIEPISYGDTISSRTFDYISKKYPYQKFILEIILEHYLISDLIEPISYSNNIMATTTFNSQGNENLITNLLVSMSDDISFEVISPMVYNEYIYTSVIYSGQGNENLNANMNIFMISTVQNTVVTPNTIIETANTFIGFEGNRVTKTLAPTVGTPNCREISGVRTYRISITNNESVSVVIRNGSTTLGTFTANETRIVTIAELRPLPYNYNINITAQASGLDASDVVNRSGTITICPIV